MVDQITNNVLPWKLVESGQIFEITPNPDFVDVKPLRQFVERINREVAAVVLNETPASQKEERIGEAKLDCIDGLRKLSHNALAFPDREEGEYFVELGRCLGRCDEQLDDLHSPEYLKLDPDENTPTNLVLGPNINDLTPEQQAVFVDLYRAKTVVNIVFERRTKVPHKNIAPATVSNTEAETVLPRTTQGLFGLGRPTSQASAVISQNVKALYLKELHDIGIVAAESPAGAAHAGKRLEAFRESFVTREAEVVKTQHIRRLGLYCFSFALIPLLAAAICLWRAGTGSEDGWHVVLIVSLMAAASTMGTWLSFALRKVSLTYGDLAGLEEDRLDPGGRVIFVMLLTTVLGLVLYSGILSISIGDIQFKFSDITVNNPQKQILYAILIGIFAGIAERSLSGLVSKQAEDIIGAPTKTKN
ncbi:hypothetical protein HFN87_27800 [Rhizobium laguerreae]|uniref:hypothetical protein n=1 Tax=Rhizobium laguerreae TaxID=1076926 RepID=UPI001C913AB2|nr:hypothetical protein [Rhizobium laguerreae]MBY3417067.1 hypothetical protein [Rhizobium laguerreae]